MRDVTTAAKRNRTILAAVLVVVLAGALVALAGPAGAQQATAENVSQCTTIDESGTYVLNQSIDSNAGPCIDITASDVTFDGQGFTLNGSGSGNGVDVANSSATLTNVTVTNVRVTNWDFGIQYSGVTNSAITDNVVTDNFNSGIRLSGSSNNTLTDNTASENTVYGMYLIEASDNEFTGNTANDNGDDGFGTGRAGPTLNNSFVDNEANDNAGAGFHLDRYSANSTLIGNTVEGNAEAGIELEGPGFQFQSRSGADNSTLRNNHVSANEDGIVLSETDNNALVDNVVSANTDDGISISESNDTILTDNTVSANGDYGISLSESSDTTLTGNDAHSNAELGFSIQGTDTTLTDNTARNNSVGFAVASLEILFGFDGGETTLTDNTASENAIGIFVLGNDVTFTNNTVTDNRVSDGSEEFSGISNGTGIAIIGSDTTLDDNTVTDNGDDGIVVSAFPDGFGIPSTDNTLVGNDVSANGGHGINLTRTTANNLFDNDVRANGGDGIHFVNDSVPTSSGPIPLAAAQAADLQPIDPDADGTFSNNDVTGNARYGVFLDGVSEHTLAQNTITGNDAAGVRLNNSTGNLLFDNVLNNTENVMLTNATGTENDWNVSKQSGPNSIDGPNVGGNYYAKPGDAEGYSETCEDRNGDGICDEPNPLDGTVTDGNTDFLPLTVPSQSNITVTPQPIDFGAVVSGETPTKNVAVTNTGEAVLTVNSVEIVGPNASAFELSGVPDEPFTIDPNAGENVAVTLSADATATCTTSATLQITSNDAEEGTIDVPLTAFVRPGRVGGFDQLPTDPDSDCRYENVNGDDEFDVVDVQALFANRNNLDTPVAFDFNGEGGVSILDVQALFAEVVNDN